MAVSPLLVVLALGAVLNLALAVVGWRRRSVPGAFPFIVLTLGIAVWAGLDVFQYSLVDREVVSLLTRVSYLGNAVVPIAAFATIVADAGRRDWFTRPVVAFLVGWPLATFAVALTTPTHGLLWSEFSVETTEPLTLADPTFGIWLWLHVAVSYALLLVAVTLLAKRIRESAGRERRRSALVLAAVLLPLLGNALWALGISPFHQLIDPAPFLFPATGLLLGVALFAYGFLDIAPVARYAIVEEMQDPVFAVDREDRIADLNPAAADLVGTASSTADVIGEPADGTVPGYDRLAGDASDPEATSASSEKRSEVSVETTDGLRCFDVRLSTLRDSRSEQVGNLVIMREVTERGENERRLAESERQHRTLLDDLPGGIVALFDEDLRYVRVGGGALERLDYANEDFEGLPIEEFHAEGFVDRFLDRYGAVFEGKRSTFEFGFADRRWRTTLVPVTDEDRDVVSGLAFTMDVTELRERERELERQNERLEEFVGVVSHDLRNPLNVLHGRLELAAETDDPTEHVERARAAADRMEELVEDLLDLARSGRDLEDVESVPLAAVARQAWATVEAPAATFAVDGATSVAADRSRLRQALENLFRNALEHGGSDVAVTVRPLDGGFAVDDDGPGFPDDVGVFEWGTSGTADGSGFGLSIVGEVAAAHGWEVRAGESPDGGARVAFRIE